MAGELQMKIIAFDLGQNFAWATNVGATRSSHSILDGPRAHRFGKLLGLLPILFEHQNYDAVIYETPFARGRDATRSLWGYAGIIEACASEAGFPVVDCAVTTLKKFATGNGRASKEEMIAAAQAMGYRGSNEHEADAYCLLLYGEANLENV
jgi:Holliday junction resolvasome RuvABC endonuclease subunit